MPRTRPDERLKLISCRIVCLLRGDDQETFLTETDAPDISLTPDKDGAWYLVKILPFSLKFFIYNMELQITI